MTIGICTDSNAQLPQELVDRFGVAIVPMTVHVDDAEYLEGVDLGADDFYAQFADGHAPVVTTSLPSPGQFALAYDELAERGCTQILSIHIAAGVSGTLNAARLAAHGSPVPVRLLDSGTASFGVACCVWAAAEAIESGASLDEASSIAETLSASITNVFIVDPTDLDRLARVAGDGLVGDGLADGPGIPVLTLRSGEVHIVERVETMARAIDLMSSLAVHSGERLRVGVGHAARSVGPLADALAHAIAAATSVSEVMRYRIGPSVGAYTGPGTVGCFTFPGAPAPSTPATS